MIVAGIIKPPRNGFLAWCGFVHAINRRRDRGYPGLPYGEVVKLIQLLGLIQLTSLNQKDERGNERDYR